MKHEGNMKKHMIVGLLSMAAVILLCWHKPIISYAYVQTEGTVTAASANIRKEASATSNVVASVVKGNKLTINDEATDSSGTLWYKVFVDANTLGYVRADLVEKAGGQSNVSNTASTTQQETTANATTNATASQPKAEVTALQSQGATVNTDDVRVRADATTSSNVVTTIKKGTAVTVSGQATGTDGKIWYQVSFIANDATVTGFIRSDFIQLGEAVEQNEDTATQPEEGESAEEPQVEQPADGTDTVSENEGAEDTPVNQDYELVYTQNADGEYEWYLYNHLEGVRNSLEDLLNAAQTNGELVEKGQSQIQKQKLVIILLAIVLVILALAVTLLLFKIRDLYYDDFNDYEDEKPQPRTYSRKSGEEPRAVKPGDERRAPLNQGVRRPVQPGARPAQPGARPVQPGTRPVQPGTRPAQPGTRPAQPGTRPAQPGTRPAQPGARPAQPGARPVHPGTRPVQPGTHPVQPGTRPVQPGTRPVHSNGEPVEGSNEKKWKSKNFMTEDDEFEFEFLNWDGDDQNDK